MDGTQAADQMQQSAAAVPPQQTPQQPQPADVNPGGQIAPVASPQVPTVDPYAHDTAFGRAAKALLGSTTDYTVDPKTGQTVATQTPTKPGAFWKNVLAAAVLGGAAGANGDPRQGFAGGITRGGAAGFADQKQQDLLKRQQAQQQFQDQNAASAEQRATDKATQDKTYNEALIANMHNEMIHRDRTSDLLDQEYQDKHNSAAMAYQKTLRDAGGIDAQIPGPDGKMVSSMTAPQLMASYMKNPSIRQAPEGFARHFIDSTDNSDITFNGINWVEADGKSVNMSDKTTIKAIDVPYDALTKSVPVSGADFNKVRGQNVLDPQKTYQISPQQMTAARGANLNEQKEQATIDLEKKKVALDGARIALEGKQLNASINAQNRSEMMGAAGFYKERIDNLEKQMQDPLMDPEAKKLAQQKIEEATGEYKSAMQKIYPNLKPTDFDASGTPKVSIGDPRVDSAVASLKGKSPEEVETFLSDPRIPESAKTAIRAGLGIKPPKPSGSKPVASSIVDGLKKLGSKLGPTTPDADESLFNQAASQK